MTEIEIATDLLTPLGAYLRLREQSAGGFLLESVERGRLGRHSFVGAGSRIVGFEEAEMLGEPVFGYLGYDAIARIEPTVPLPAEGPDTPESRWLVPDVLVRFDHAFASLTYSGYGHFDSDEFCGGIGELGDLRDSVRYGSARRALATARSAAEEAAQKASRGYGGARHVASDANAPHHQHFGFIIASCERADLRPQPDRVLIYGDLERREESLPPPTIPRREVIDELYDAVVHGIKPLHSGEWSLATIEVCAAILQSASERREIALRRQIACG